MSEDPNEIPPRPVIYTSRSEGDWGAALIAACLAVGFFMSWGTYELRQRLAGQSQVRGFRHDLDAVMSQQSDLGWLLADPRTKLIRLSPAYVNSPIRAASVAWNPSSRRGAIFCNDLTADGSRRYQVWLIPVSGPGTAIGFGPTEPGQTIYSLIPAPGDADVSPAEIVLTQWNVSTAAALAKGNVADQE